MRTIRLTYSKDQLQDDGATCMVGAVDPVATCLQLRERYARHDWIATLASTDVVADLGVTAETKERIEHYLASLFHDLGNCPLDSWHGAINAIRNGRHIADGLKSEDIRDIYKNKPCVCIASGPSASKYLDAIREIRESVVVIACDSILAGCLAHGIEPDFVTMMERDEILSPYLQVQRPARTMLVATPVVAPCSIEGWENSVVWWWSGDLLCTWLDPKVPPLPLGRSAGTMAVILAAHLGCDRIWLVGHDLAKIGGASHSQDANAIAAQEQGKAEKTDPGCAEITVPGYCLPVTSCPMWQCMRQDIESIIGFHPDRQWFHVGADGSKIAGPTIASLPVAPDLVPLIPVPYPTATRTHNPEELRATVRSDCVDFLMKVAAIVPRLNAAMTGQELDSIAQEIQVSRNVSIRNAELFQYVLRSLYHAALLRIHLRESEGVLAQKLALCSVVRTLPAVLRTMMEDVCPSA